MGAEQALDHSRSKFPRFASSIRSADRIESNRALGARSDAKTTRLAVRRPGGVGSTLAVDPTLDSLEETQPVIVS